MEQKESHRIFALTKSEQEQWEYIPVLQAKPSKKDIHYILPEDRLRQDVSSRFDSTRLHLYFEFDPLSHSQVQQI